MTFVIVMGFHQIIVVMNDVKRHTYTLEDGYNVDVIYLDFSKAFDKLDFAIVLKKMNEIGIRGNIGKWIYSFLTNRDQVVLVNGARSSPEPVISGVPQGSVIGPLLFLIQISDIDEHIQNSFLSSFADDTRIGKGIKNAKCTKATK